LLSLTPATLKIENRDEKIGRGNLAYTGKITNGGYASYL
jgi:hypothetical protein